MDFNRLILLFRHSHGSNIGQDKTLSQACALLSYRFFVLHFLVNAFEQIECKSWGGCFICVLIVGVMCALIPTRSFSARTSDTINCNAGLLVLVKLI